RLGVEARALADDADRHADLGRIAKNIDSSDSGLPFVRARESRQDLDGRGLARSVRSEQPEDRAGLDGEVESRQGAHLAVGFAETARLDRVLALVRELRAVHA